MAKERIIITTVEIWVTDSDLSYQFLFLFLDWWVFELPKFEKFLAILSLCIRTLVGIIPFLVAFEAFHILDIYWLPRNRCFRVICKRRPDKSLGIDPWFPGYVSFRSSIFQLRPFSLPALDTSRMTGNRSLPEIPLAWPLKNLQSHSLKYDEHFWLLVPRPWNPARVEHKYSETSQISPFLHFLP